MVVVTSNTLVTQQLFPDSPHQDRKSVWSLPEDLVLSVVLSRRSMKIKDLSLKPFAVIVRIIISIHLITEEPRTHLFIIIYLNWEKYL